MFFNFYNTFLNVSTYICKASFLSEMAERGHHIRLEIIPFEKELLIGRHHGNADFLMQRNENKQQNRRASKMTTLALA